jgi:hypothetical protein
MYTNIDTMHALDVLRRQLTLQWYQRRQQGLDVGVLIAALTIIMRGNVFSFGDTYWYQLTGCAMGTPPACAYATLYFSEHEEEVRKAFTELLFQKRYIDDLFGIWVPQPHTDDNLRWNLYQTHLNT